MVQRMSTSDLMQLWMPVWPLFIWRECATCGKEFRRELGERRWVYMYPQLPQPKARREEYRCAECKP